MAGIESLRNLGPKSRALLAEIGVGSEDDLRALGPVEAYARLRFRFGRAISRNMLRALAAALEGVDWRRLPPDVQADLDAKADLRLAHVQPETEI